MMLMIIESSWAHCGSWLGFVTLEVTWKDKIISYRFNACQASVLFFDFLDALEPRTEDR